MACRSRLTLTDGVVVLALKVTVMFERQVTFSRRVMDRL